MTPAWESNKNYFDHDDQIADSDQTQVALDTGGFSVSELRNKRRLSKMNCEVTEPEDVKKKSE